MNPALLSGILYHGTARRNVSFSPDRPAYLTPCRIEAQTYADMDAEIEGGTPAVLTLKIIDPAAKSLPMVLMQDLHLREHDSLVASLVAQGYNCAIANDPENFEVAVFGAKHLRAA
jgi:hypothetical protein